MSKKTICYFVDTPIIELCRTILMIDTFKEAGFEVLLNDVSALINPKAHQTVKQGLINYEAYGVNTFISWKALKKYISQMDVNTIAIDTGSWDLNHYPIYHSLSKKNIPYGYLILNSCYEMASKTSIVDRIKNYLTHHSIKRFFNSIFTRLPKYWFKDHSCRFLISNSSIEIDGYKKRFYCDEHTEYLFVHSDFYEQALSIRGEPRIVPNKYCVWLDSYIPYHPDNEQLGIEVDPDSYYASLRRLFAWIQANMEVEVVISAHPRSDYAQHPEAYEGYRIIKNKTCLLVRDAEFVISAASTSVLAAVMYWKPILFIVQDAIKETLKHHIALIEQLSSELNAKVLDIDEDSFEEMREYLAIDEEAYQRCANGYIKLNHGKTICGDSNKDEIIGFVQNIFNDLEAIEG